jgi:Flp pilus assembly protein TadG
MRLRAQLLRLLRRDERGNTAVEFAMIAPAFLMIIVGGFYVAHLAFAAGSMQYAVEAGARCASVKTTVCTNSTTTIAYAKKYFKGVGATVPTYTSTSATCGHLVSGSMSYSFKTGIKTINVPLSAQACYP